MIAKRCIHVLKWVYLIFGTDSKLFGDRIKIVEGPPMVQPLTITELTTARDALRQAEALVVRVRGLHATNPDIS